MKQFFLFAVFVQLSINTFAQQKKIAYRRDDYVNNAWQGKDSILYDYNSDSNLVATFAIKGNTTNTWDINYKYTYLYNADKKIAYQLREKANGSNWINDNQYTYTYDGNNDLTLVAYDLWNGTSWKNTGRIEYSGYNTYHKYTLELLKSWNGSGWANISKNEKAYINNQYLIQYDDRYVWNTTLVNWEKYDRHYYTYQQDSIGSDTYSLPDTLGNWKSQQKTVYTWNFTNWLLQKTTNQLFDTASLPYDVSRNIFSYSATNKLLESKYEVPVGTTWVANKRTTYLYNTNDLVSEYFSEVNTGIWENEEKRTFVYNAALKVEEEIKLNGVGSSWIEAEKYNYTYDANGNNIFLQREDYNGTVFSPVKREFFYYNIYPLNLVDNSLIAAVNIYPNPTQHVLFIDYNAPSHTLVQVHITDINGRLWMTIMQPVQKGKSIIEANIANLPPGSYIVDITDTKSGKSNAKVINKR